MKKAWKRLKYIFSDDNSQKELTSILSKLRASAPYLYIEFNQRHFVGRQKSFKDGYLLLNLDTMGKPFRKESSKTKESKIWFQALKDAIIHKRNINGQVAFIVKFFRHETKGIETPKFLNEVKKTLKELKPLYDFLKINN